MLGRFGTDTLEWSSLQQSYRCCFCSLGPPGNMEDSPFGYICSWGLPRQSLSCGNRDPVLHGSEYAVQVMAVYT